MHSGQKFFTSIVSVSLLLGAGRVNAQTTEGTRIFKGSTTNQVVSVQQSGSGFGLSASTPSTKPVGAIFGLANGKSGFTNGVWGRSFSPAGVGVRGEAMATSGVATGVFGSSASFDGVGVFGHANGNGSGILGVIDSLDFGGAGVMGQSGISCCGTPGVFEQEVDAPSGSHGSGTLLAAQTNTNGTVKQVFFVDISGGVHGSSFQTFNADFAESLPVQGARSGYSAGDVLAIDESSQGHLTRTAQPYSTLVAGIYSTAPGVLGGFSKEKMATDVPLAVVGIVPCKVTTENGPVHTGDLLVSSSKAGYAMKGTDRNRMVGAVVGKALDPLPRGDGIIKVLVTLQ